MKQCADWMIQKSIETVASAELVAGDYREEQSIAKKDGKKKFVRYETDLAFTPVTS